MRHHQRLHRIGAALGHSGYLLGLLEYGMTDIFWLRIWAICGCGMVVAYQCLQPRVQWISAGWCAAYVAVNVVQLSKLQSVDPPTLTWEEERLHTLFARHITAAQFWDVLSAGEWLWLVDGALLSEEATDREECRLTFITDGACEVRVGGRGVAELGPGSVVGEMALLAGDATADADDGAAAAECGGAAAVAGAAVAGAAAATMAAAGAPTTVVAIGSVRCFSVPAARVRDLLREKPELRRPLEGIFASALAGKVSAMNEEMKQRNYRAVLEVACVMDDYEGILSSVEQYRRRHAVSDDLHQRLLEDVPQCSHRPFTAAAAAIAPLAAAAPAPVVVLPAAAVVSA